MCTLTWTHDEEGYEVFFNRDESVRRQPGLAPSRRTEGGVTYIAPTDRDAGGTWIGVNQHGITACLLNYYEQTFDPTARVETGYVSRGQIVRDVLSESSEEGVRAFMERFETGLFRPFQLVVFGPGWLQETKGPLSFLWKGTGRPVISRPGRPISSSGFDPQGVIARRTELFNRLLVDWRKQESGEPDYRFFYAYHASQTHGREPYSVCMQRSDARTVSFTHVCVDPKHVHMYYSQEPLCLQEKARDGGPSALPEITLERQTA